MNNDIISRWAAIRWVKTECNPYGNPTLDFESGKKVMEHLEQMPSVQPELITKIQNGIKAINADDVYSCGMRNGMRWCMSLIDGKEPLYENCPPTQPGCEDAVPRTSVEYICRKNTVSTNPYEHKYHDKFIQFMDNSEISDFGRWQHSNGFNTALVAVKCDLDKVPSAQQKKLKYSGESICLHCKTKDCDGCLFEPMEGR